MFISQQRYLESVLQRYGMENCKSISTPLEPGKHLFELSDDDEAFDKGIYQQAIGCLTYLSTVTRPDIAAVVRILSLDSYQTDTSISERNTKLWVEIF